MTFDRSVPAAAAALAAALLGAVCAPAALADEPPRASIAAAAPGVAAVECTWTRLPDETRMSLVQPTVDIENQHEDNTTPTDISGTIKGIDFPTLHGIAAACIAESGIQNASPDAPLFLIESLPTRGILDRVRTLYAETGGNAEAETVGLEALQPARRVDIGDTFAQTPAGTAVQIGRDWLRSIGSAMRPAIRAMGIPNSEGPVLRRASGLVSFALMRRAEIEGRARCFIVDRVQRCAAPSWAARWRESHAGHAPPPAAPTA
jgi:hypothetical protein